MVIKTISSAELKSRIFHFVSKVFSANVLAFDKGFALTNTKAAKTWTTITVEDHNLASKVVIEFRIVCAEQFYGDFCERTCIPSGTNVICSSTGTLICAPGWSGEKCDQGKPVCKQCGANGRCVQPGICQCDIGWTGKSCEKCLVKPNCVHGTCQKPNECNCEKGWGGQYCNIGKNPCQNGGFCEVIADGFLCRCESGFYGHFCEFSVNSCLTAVCANGGTCIHKPGGDYECRCLPGYIGRNCDIKDISCYNFPCRFLFIIFSRNSNTLCFSKWKHMYSDALRSSLLMWSMLSRSRLQND
uniref:Delta-like protein n=1 Tax=Syphacia muris TaxID=451379 RepID=A0A0N5AY98_9BILA